MSWDLIVLDGNPAGLTDLVGLEPLDRTTAKRLLSDDLHGWAGDTLVVEGYPVADEDAALRYLAFSGRFDSTPTDADLDRQRREYRELLLRLHDLADALDAQVHDPNAAASSTARSRSPSRPTWADHEEGGPHPAGDDSRRSKVPPWPRPPALAAFGSYPFQGRVVEIAGCRMHHVNEGTGPPILFLHGNPTWS